MSDLIKQIILTVINTMLVILKDILSKEKFIEYGDKILDAFERWVEKEPDWYDELLMKFVAIIREMVQIPDLPDDEPE